MPLIEQTMTEKNLAAHRRNAQLSRGAATPEGKARARAANLRHGYYSGQRDEALAAFGEDPEALAALVEGARRQFRPANAYQAWIIGRLASMQWRMARAERKQESLAAAHIRKLEANRQEEARQQRERCADVQDFLSSLLRAAARPDFFTPAACIHRCEQVMEQSPSESMEQILDLLHQLRRPERFTEPPAPPAHEAMGDDEWQQTVEGDEEDELTLSDSETEVAEGEARDPLREQLWNLAADELREATESWAEEIAALEAPLSISERDVLVVEISKELELMRREERSCFREFCRLGNELRKLQKESEVQDNRDQPPQFEAPPESEDAPKASIAKNAGPSGYVDENKGALSGVAAKEYPCSAGPSRIPPAPGRDILTELTSAPTAASPPPAGPSSGA